jgi:hypothetical protein
MYMRRAKFVIDFKDLDSFVAAFFSKMKVGIAFPAKVTVILGGNRDVDVYGRDLLAFLKARSLARVVHWKFESVKYQYPRDMPYGVWTLHKVFNTAAGLSIRKLFKAIGSGTITDAKIGLSYFKTDSDHPHDTYWHCHFAMKKSALQLGMGENSAFEALCKQLPFLRTAVIVDVVDDDGAVVKTLRWRTPAAEAVTHIHKSEFNVYPKLPAPQPVMEWTPG